MSPAILGIPRESTQSEGWYKALGLTIPLTLQAAADELIE